MTDQTAHEAFDDVPAVFRLPASKKSLDQNQFKFQLPGEDRVRSVPKLKFLRPSLAIRFQDMAIQDAVLELFGLFEPDVIEKLDDMDQFEQLMVGWAKASGITLGESLPSSDSSESTEGQPNTTSGNTDSTSTTSTQDA